jgi:hypothetical protein
MGMSEDDRIRRKNYSHNEGYKIYQTLKALGYPDSSILEHASMTLETSDNSYRNEIYKNVISIARSSSESKGIST